MHDLIQRLLDAQPQTMTEDMWISVGYLMALRDQLMLDGLEEE